MEINKRWNDYKVCLCGQFGVGKTTIFQKVADNFGSSLESVSKGDFAYVIDDPDLGQKKVRINSVKFKANTDPLVGGCCRHVVIINFQCI